LKSVLTIRTFRPISEPSMRSGTSRISLPAMTIEFSISQRQITQPSPIAV
jgi:hypothetical protein